MRKVTLKLRSYWAIWLAGLLCDCESSGLIGDFQFELRGEALKNTFKRHQLKGWILNTYILLEMIAFSMSGSVDETSRGLNIITIKEN